MLLKTKVKVGNITNLSDARYCAGMGVDLLGFPIGNNPEQITPEMFQGIAEWVVGPEFVLEYTDAMDQDQFEKVTHFSTMQHIQLTYPQLTRLESKINNMSIILVTDTAEWPSITSSIANLPISYLILGNADTPLHVEKIAEINSVIPVLIPYSLLTFGVQQIADLPISGIVLKGTAEDKPGQSNYDQLASVLELLEID